MARANATLQRLYVEADLATDTLLPLAEKQSHYLRNVMRLQAGDAVLLFNGRDGEWRARLHQMDKKAVTLEIAERTRAQDTQQDTGGDIWLLVAPVKKDRLDYLAQKATEMGAARLLPVITKRTQQKSAPKRDKLLANAIEAAEQCNLLSLPQIDDAQKLSALLADWPSDRKLLFCDEEAANGTGASELVGLKGEKLAVLIGPEGGFDDDERAALTALPQVVSLSLGPRILRTDTAVVAALTLLQAHAGDW